jgi:tetratricopeptide (TPR) repeat protein
MNVDQRTKLTDRLHGALQARRLPTWLTLSMASLAGAPLSAQELPLKHDYPGSGSYTCPAPRIPPSPTLDAAARASQLGRDANQADILGDLETARDLLSQAAEADPTSAILAYRYARVLEDLGERDAAMAELCRVLAVASDEEEVADAPARLEALHAEDVSEVPPAAVEAFRTGVSQAESGRLEEADSSLATAVAEDPRWADASYNRGVVLSRLGRRDEAVEALRRYLTLEPGAPDAVAVSERIGDLERTRTQASPPTTLTLGMLVPGMGQMYSGRQREGLAVLGVAGVAVAAGFLIREVTTLCLANQTTFSECPPDQVYFEESTRPYLAPALGVAAAVTVVSAVEAFVKARRAPPTSRSFEPESAARSAFLLRPTVRAQGRRVEIRILRVTF